MILITWRAISNNLNQLGGVIVEVISIFTYNFIKLVLRKLQNEAVAAPQSPYRSLRQLAIAGTLQMVSSINIYPTLPSNAFSFTFEAGEYLCLTPPGLWEDPGARSRYSSYGSYPKWNEHSHLFPTHLQCFGSMHCHPIDCCDFEESWPHAPGSIIDS